MLLKCCASYRLMVAIMCGFGGLHMWCRNLSWQPAYQPPVIVMLISTTTPKASDVACPVWCHGHGAMVMVPAHPSAPKPTPVHPYHVRLPLVLWHCSPGSSLDTPVTTVMPCALYSVHHLTHSCCVNQVRALPVLTCPYSCPAVACLCGNACLKQNRRTLLLVLLACAGTCACAMCLR